MPKLYILVIALSLTGLMLALVSILMCLTQLVNIQIVFFQSLYWAADRVWGVGRAILYLFVALTASTTAIVYFREFSGELNTRRLGWIFLFLACGMFLGLVVHYGYVCCDSPVIFRFGFPFSWVSGVTSSWYYLPTSTTSYLIHNFTSFKWCVIPWNLFANFVFWFNVGFLFFPIRKLRWILETKTSNLQYR